MTMLRKGDWVLVADGEKAMFLENTGDTSLPRLTLRDQDARPNPPAREQASDRPGRYRDNGPGQRSAYAETDYHEQAKRDFAELVAGRLSDHAGRGDFDRIVLVASAEVLGALRARISDEVAERVVGEVPKLLTNHPVDKLGEIVMQALEV